MAEKKLHFEIITPGEILVSDEIDTFEAPGINGEFQILVGHTPFLTGLKIGYVIFSKNGSKEYVSISGGFCEVKQDKAVILAPTAEKKSKIDKSRAEEAKKRAEARLVSKGDPNINEERARLSLLRAINRIQLSEM